MSPLIPLTSTPGRKSEVPTKPDLNKSLGAIKTPGKSIAITLRLIIYFKKSIWSVGFIRFFAFFFAGVTPFVFNGNNSMSVTPGVTKKNTFDLKASLSRPVTYKPHKGMSTLACMPRTHMISGSASLIWIVSACFSLSSFTSVGKLKPFGAQQEIPALNKSVNTDSGVTVPSHQKNYKQHQVQTRWDAYFSCALIGH